jgi:hypothetical protein
MWCAHYWARRMFAARYWAKVGAAPPIFKPFWAVNSSQSVGVVQPFNR